MDYRDTCNLLFYKTLYWNGIFAEACQVESMNLRRSDCKAVRCFWSTELWCNVINKTFSLDRVADASTSQRWASFDIDVRYIYALQWKGISDLEFCFLFFKERLKTLKVDVDICRYITYVMLTYWQCLTDLCFDGRCLSFVVSLCCFLLVVFSFAILW